MDDAFLDIGTLFSQLLENLALCDFRIEGEQPVYVVLYACKALLRGGEVQKLFRGQHPCPVDDGTVGVVDNHVSVGRILPAEEHEVDAELFLQLFLQLFLAAAHVPVFFEDAPQLAATGAFPITAFEKLFDFGQRNLPLHLAAMLDEYFPFFLIYLISHRNHDCLELGERGEGILSGRVHVVGNLLLPVRAENPVYDFLGTPALVTVGYLPAVGGDTRGDDVQVGVVGVMVGVDEPRLSGFGISHFLEVSVREIQQFGFRHLTAFAADGHMELRFPDAAVGGTVFFEIAGKLLRGGSACQTDCPEVPHLDEPGKPFRYLMFVVTHGVEVRASG